MLFLLATLKAERMMTTQLPVTPQAQCAPQLMTFGVNIRSLYHSGKLRIASRTQADSKKRLRGMTDIPHDIISPTSYVRIRQHCHWALQALPVPHIEERIGAVKTLCFIGIARRQEL